MTVDQTQIKKFVIEKPGESQIQSLKDLHDNKDLNNRYEPIAVESIYSDE